MILGSLWIDYNEVVALRGIKNKKPGLCGTGFWEKCRIIQN